MKDKYIIKLKFGWQRNDCRELFGVSTRTWRGERVHGRVNKTNGRINSGAMIQRFLFRKAAKRYSFIASFYIIYFTVRERARTNSIIGSDGDDTIYNDHGTRKQGPQIFEIDTPVGRE